MKRFALLMVVLTLLAPQAWVLAASYQEPKGPKHKAEKTKGPQNKQDKHDKKDKKYKGDNEEATTVPVSVPEPATITLLAAGAGAAMARKLWKNRQQR